MSSDITALKRSLTRLLAVYAVGSFLFFIFAVASVCFGYYLLAYRREHDLPLSLVLISLAGVLLLWEMGKAFRVKAPLPENFRKISRCDYPALFDIIDEVTAKLELSPVHEVYICPDANASVFVQATLRNLLLPAKRNLAVGLGFLTQMDDDELRAVLYHEFGHYAQKEMQKSVSVYSAGRFARSFKTTENMRESGTFEMQTKTQLLIYTWFALAMCNRIDRAYSRLARQMEYDADDVAAKYAGKALLQRTLLHAACIGFNYEAVHWGMQCLQSEGICIREPYRALRLVGRYSRPPSKLLSAEVIRRVERLGKLSECRAVASPAGVRNSVPAFLLPETPSSRAYSAEEFAVWFRDIIDIYAKSCSEAVSVRLEIHLYEKKYKIPYIDSFYEVLLNGRKVGTGNFIKGYTLKRRTYPGKHTITVYAPNGIISTPFEFTVESRRAYRIEMDYKMLKEKNGLYDVFGASICEIPCGD